MQLIVLYSCTIVQKTAASTLFAFTFVNYLISNCFNLSVKIRFKKAILNNAVSFKLAFCMVFSNFCANFSCVF